MHCSVPHARATAATLAALLLATSALGQRPTANEALDEECSKLLADLEPDPGRPTPTLSEQIKAIGAFVERHPADRSRVCILKLRIRLGTLLLHAGQLEVARRTFVAVVEDVPLDERDLPGQRDFLGRARYGQAQALELLDKVDDARAVLQQLLVQHAGERYAKFAKVALQRLSPQKGVGALAGMQAPTFASEPLLDLDDHQHLLRSYLGQPLLLVFWSPEVEASVARLRAVTAAWKRSGVKADTVLAFALATSRAAALRARKILDLDMPIIAADDEFLHPTALAYRVTKVPTVILIGADGTVLGRDLPAREIERIVGLTR